MTTWNLKRTLAWLAMALTPILGCAVDGAPETTPPAPMKVAEGATPGHVTLPSKLMATGNETVTTDSATYATGSPIHVTWTNFPGNVYDWISISLSGSPDGSYVSYQYTFGAAAGSADFTGIGPGTYVARGHENNGNTVLASSTTFTVTGGATTVSTDKSSYTQAEAVQVTYANMQGNVNDWISIAPAGSPATTYLSYSYTNGGLAGTRVFPLTGLTDGDYVARAYFHDSYTIAAESAVFHVGGVTVATDKSTYAVAEPIMASWSNLPGNAHDWIALAYQGSAAASYVRWTYTNGATSGSYSFQGLSAGTYVARVFIDDGAAIAAESAPFQVGATPTVTTDKSAYSSAETAQLMFANAPATMDWVAIAANGAPLSSYAVWQYTGGGAGGTIGLSLAGLSTGTYVARLFTNNTYDLLATSATFTVTAAAGTTVSSDAATYNFGDTVTIHYAGMAGNTFDWIGISAPTAPAGDYVQWAYVYAMTSGDQPFHNLPPGTYVARAYFNNGSVVQAESAQFTVQGATTCTTDKATYANGETVTVSYSGMLGHALDWVSLSTPGSPEGSYVYWTFTGGGAAGSKAFANVAPGTYVARCHFQNENTVRASSAQITVNP